MQDKILTKQLFKNDSGTWRATTDASIENKFHKITIGELPNRKNISLETTLQLSQSKKLLT